MARGPSRRAQRRYMRIDSAPLWHLACAGAVAAAVLAAAVVAGLLTPAARSSRTLSAFACPDGSHRWHDGCAGVRPALSNATWTHAMGRLSPWGGFWAVAAAPYHRGSGGEPTPAAGRTFTVVAEVRAQMAESASGPWSAIEPSGYYALSFYCSSAAVQYGDRCAKVQVANVQLLHPKHYRLSVRFVNATDILGDVEFTVQKGTPEFAYAELVVNVSTMVWIALVMFFFLRAMRGVEWNIEQRLVFYACIVLLVNDNPLPAFKYLAWKPFWVSLDTVFHNIFVSTLMLYWLVLLEVKTKDARGDSRTMSPSALAVKLLLALAIFAVTAAMTIYDSMLGMKNPFYSSQSDKLVITILFVIVAVLFGAIMSWCVVLFFHSFPPKRTSVEVSRYLFSLIPFAIVAFCMVVGLYDGCFGPMRQSALEMIFFEMLYNVYLTFLIFGFWPKGPILFTKIASAINAGDAEDTIVSPLLAQ